MVAQAMKVEPERPMEERVARFEANVEHIQSDISEMKDDIRRLDVKIDAVKDSVTVLRDETKTSIATLSLNMEKSFASLKIGRMVDKVWWLLIAAAILSVMARGFKWI